MSVSVAAASLADCAVPTATQGAPLKKQRVAPVTDPTAIAQREYEKAVARWHGLVIKYSEWLCVEGTPPSMTSYQEMYALRGEICCKGCPGTIRVAGSTGNIGSWRG